ncbi:MAG: tetratricopeptide repeat protein [Desulfobacteraceae bacterium]|nr:tetratricopeptide repeat protein [Desulfobacteraceae bacterium]
MSFKLMVSGILLAIFCTVSGCGSKEEKIAAFIAKGDHLCQSGDPIRAVLEYKNALQLDVRNVPATLALARAYFVQKDFPKAYSAFSSALALAPGCDAARLELASLQVMAGEYEAALEKIGEISSPDANRAAKSLTEARALIGLGRHPEAISVLTGLEGGESGKDGQVLLALAYDATGNAEGLKNAVLRWRSHDPRDPNSYLLLARHYAAGHEEEKAKAQLREMVDSIPDDPVCPILRAQELEDMGYMGEAANAFESLADDDAALVARAGFWARRNNLVKARGFLEELVKRNPKDVEMIHRLAVNLMETGDYAEAAGFVDGALGQDLSRPERERVLLTKALMQARTGNLEGARKICEAILNENQGNFDAHLLMGKLWLKLRDPSRAEIHLSQVVTARPGDEEAQLYLSRSRLLKQSDVSAVETLKTALKVNPSSRKIRMELLRHLIARNEIDQALKVLDRGIESDAGNVFLINIRAELETSEKNWKAAEQDYRRIVSLRPNNPLGYVGLARLMFAQAKNEEALRLAGRAIDLEGGMQMALPLVLHFYLSGNDAPSAIRMAQDMVGKHPDSSLAYFFLGQAYLAAEDLEKAENAFRKAAQLSPDWLEPYRFISAIFLNRGDLEDAILRAEKLQQSDPSISNLIQLTFFYEDSKRRGDAIKAYAALLDRGLKGPELYNNLAFLLAEQSNEAAGFKKASELIDHALQQQPENPFFLDTAAWIAYKQEDYGTAWIYIQESANRQQHALHNLHAALILKARGDKSLALKYVDRALQGRLDTDSQRKALTLQEELSESLAQVH